MKVHGAVQLFVLLSFLYPPALAQEILPVVTISQPASTDFSAAVLPISDIKFIGVGFEAALGTGFCLDAECRFVGTNYHVAAMAHPHKVDGERVIHTYLATGPKDEGATMNSGVAGGTMRYTLVRDLAIFELRRPLLHRHGAPFSLDDLVIGQAVDVYVYPKEGISPVRKLLHFRGAFVGESPSGLLVFSYSLSSGKAIRGGASGGIVVDAKTGKIVGVVNSIATDGELVVVAVPVQSLADFVRRTQPVLADTLFRSPSYVSPVSPDFYARLGPPAPRDVLQHRPDESPEVTKLRSKAQALADSIQNFVAVQTYFWGSGNRLPSISESYEIRVIDGEQRFRTYPDGKKQMSSVPFPPLSNSLVPSAEWSELPKMVGTELKLRIEGAADVAVEGRPVKVFRYRADREDDLCRFEDVYNFVFFSVKKRFILGCYGEVWTDQDTNILRISEHFELTGDWKDYQGVVTYGWLRRPGDVPRLVPLTISTQVRTGKKVYWCRGVYTSYRAFSSKATILSGSAGQGAPGDPEALKSRSAP